MIFRLIFNGCLACFTGMVLIKINEPAQIFDLGSSFNGRVMLFHGSAPDQYRILPFALMRAVYVSMKAAIPGISLNAALQVFNIISAFFLFEISYLVLRNNTPWPPRNLLIINGIFAVGHAYTQILYWKPDALFTLAMCMLLVHFFFIKNRLAILFSILVLSFCRADLGLLYAVFYILIVEKNSNFKLNAIKTILIAMPIVTQLFIQKVLFPEAHYFCDVIQIKENLNVFRIFRMPFTWLMICIFMLFGKQIFSFFKNNWHQWRVAIILMIGYFCLIACVARVSEYRLYLPLLPLVLFVYLMTLKNYNFFSWQSTSSN